VAVESRSRLGLAPRPASAVAAPNRSLVAKGKARVADPSAHVPDESTQVTCREGKAPMEEAGTKMAGGRLAAAPGSFMTDAHQGGHMLDVQSSAANPQIASQQ
jgi:hypothetical protein